MDKYSGEAIVGRSFAKLHTTPQVESAVNRAKIRGKDVNRNSSKSMIKAYLDRFEELEHKPEPVKERLLGHLKTTLHNGVIVKPENVPGSHFELQVKIAREQGYGVLEITDQMRQLESQRIIADQKKSFDIWVDYMASIDAPYPVWFKYWTVANVARMTPIDKITNKFGKRDEKTVKIFPELNREALAYAYDLVQQRQLEEGEGINNKTKTANEDQKQLRSLVEQTSFSTLYAFAVDKAQPVNYESKERIQGSWTKYQRGGDYRALANSLQGYGTGWCTAGEATAKTQLENGDFYVYYSKNEKGKNTVPRIAIRMENGKVIEVRGISANQGMEDEMLDIAKSKYRLLPGGNKFEKKDIDMKMMTVLEKKVAGNVELDVDELVFLWELKWRAKIEGFGYQEDPRIEQIRKERDIVGDFLRVPKEYRDKAVNRYLLAEIRSDQIKENSQERALILVDLHGKRLSALSLAYGITNQVFAGKNLEKAWSIINRKGDFKVATVLADAIAHNALRGEDLAKAWVEVENKGKARAVDELVRGIAFHKVMEGDLERAWAYIDARGDVESAKIAAWAVAFDHLDGENLVCAWKLVELKGDEVVVYQFFDGMKNNTISVDNKAKMWSYFEQKGSEYVYAVASAIGGNKMEDKDLTTAWSFVEARGDDDSISVLFSRICEKNIEPKYVERLWSLAVDRGGYRTHTAVAEAISRNDFGEEGTTMKAWAYINSVNDYNYSDIFAHGIAEGRLSGQSLDEAWKYLEHNGDHSTIRDLKEIEKSKRVTTEERARAHKLIGGIRRKWLQGKINLLFRK